jgi:hypothetical protein
MINFIRDMIIGWIIYTESGKKTANSIVNYAYKQIKSSISSNHLSTTNKKGKINEFNDNRTKDRQNTQ